MDSQFLLKIRYNCPYNYQRALNKNLIMIFGWFTLLRNIIGKYKIQLKDFYNFDKIDFMMNVIIIFFIITHSEKYKKVKII